MSNGKILVVDDNPVVCKALETKLKGEGYEVFTALEGAEAVSCARAEQPDVIILDINFPPDVAHGGGIGWSGFRIIDWLRTTGASRAPIILITGENVEHYREQALRAKVAGIFQKPMNPTTLLEAIKTTLEARETMVHAPNHTAEKG